MSYQQQPETQITKRSLREAGFYQIEKDSFSNGVFDLILSDTGSVILYAQGNTRSVCCVTDMHLLNSYVNYNIIASVGVCRQ